MDKNGPETNAITKLHPVTTQRASEAIYEQIKALILSGELKPGDRLPSERSLMETLQRSRPTIREALRMLEHAGLIRTAPGANGAVVREPDTGEVEESLMVMLRTSHVTAAELSEYRLCNETAVARWAAERRAPADLEALSGLLDRAAALVDAADFEGFIEADAAFHHALARAGGNAVAAALARILGRLTEPLLRAKLQRQSGGENGAMCRRILAMHREIYDAVRSGDAEAAARAMAAHIEAFGADLAD